MSQGTCRDAHESRPNNWGGCVVCERVCQFRAAWYCSMTEAGTRPRLETSTPLEAAHARTAFRSTLLLVALLLLACRPPVLRAAASHGASCSRSFLAFLSLRSSS